MRKLIVFNWKLNPGSLAQAKVLVKAAAESTSPAVQTVVCPPFEYLFSLRAVFDSRSRQLAFGAQNCFWENRGEHTGEVSPLLLKKQGVQYVILGHSERRLQLLETETMVAKKVQAALNAGLKVILCVGEDRVIHNQGAAATKRWLWRQVLESLAGVRRKQLTGLSMVYEPVWAISSQSKGRSDAPKHVAVMSGFLREVLQARFPRWTPRILYGGSVNSRNALELLRLAKPDGFLVGAASLDSREVRKLLAAVVKYKSS